MATSPTVPLRRDAYGFPMFRRWLGPWVLVAGRWWRLAVVHRGFESIGSYRWERGPAT